MKPLHSLAKRDLLAAKKFDPEDVRAYADDFLAQERYGDAFEFYRKLDDAPAIRKLKDAVIKAADTEVLWRIEHADREAVAREDWLACGRSALAADKFRCAAFAFRHAGYDEQLAEAESHFKPPEEQAETESPSDEPS